MLLGRLRASSASAATGPDAALWAMVLGGGSAAPPQAREQGVRQLAPAFGELAMK
jgi:hypothetical protein